MWLIRNFAKKTRTTVRISWISVLFCCTFLLMIAAITKFRHECFHLHVQLFTSERQIRRCDTGLKTENNLGKISSFKVDYEHISDKQLRHTTENEQDNEQEENLDLSKQTVIRSEILEYFSSRRNSTKQACLTMFRLEDESQNKLIFEDDPSQTGSETEGTKHTTQSSLRLESESKFFMRASNPTKWIFYKHKPNQIELQWCPLYKSGSSSWMALFAKLSGALSEKTERQIRAGSITFMHLAKNFRMFHSSGFANLVREDKPQVYTMVVVRHPFKRLLSAYRDKLERIKGREYYHQTIGKTIIQRFRRAGKNDNQVVNILGQRFTMRRGKIISVTDLQPGPIRNGRNISIANKTVFNQNGINANNSSIYYNPAIPTFEEFCKYLISVSPTTMNEHWRPQFLDCSPCHHKFDLILKVEDIENDKLQVFKLLGLNNVTSTEYQEIENVWENWTNRNVYGGAFKESFYFSQLSDFLIRQLYDLYAPDFDLFGYSPDEYFSMTKNI